MDNNEAKALRAVLTNPSSEKGKIMERYADEFRETLRAVLDAPKKLQYAEGFVITYHGAVGCEGRDKDPFFEYRASSRMDD
jgi:hypothetical protein